MRTEINTNIDVINNRINSACAASNRNIHDITLVAVSKRKNNELIEFALDCGVKNFGENYACLLYTSPSPRDRQKSRMPSSA